MDNYCEACATAYSSQRALTKHQQTAKHAEAVKAAAGPMPGVTLQDIYDAPVLCQRRLKISPDAASHHLAPIGAAEAEHAMSANDGNAYDAMRDCQEMAAESSTPEVWDAAAEIITALDAATACTCHSDPNGICPQHYPECRTCGDFTWHEALASGLCPRCTPMSEAEQQTADSLLPRLSLTPAPAGGALRVHLNGARLGSIFQLSPDRWLAVSRKHGHVGTYPTQADAVSALVA